MVMCMQLDLLLYLIMHELLIFRNACEKIWGEELKDLVEERGRRGIHKLLPASLLLPLSLFFLSFPFLPFSLSLFLSLPPPSLSPSLCYIEQISSICHVFWQVLVHWLSDLTLVTHPLLSLRCWTSWGQSLGLLLIPKAIKYYRLTLELFRYAIK